MRQHLVFTLYGPLQAWGTVAVGEVRPVSGHPTRSGVIGLLAAALGVRRDEGGCLLDLHEKYGVAVRVDAPGVRMTDYHTVQTPVQKAKREFFCRRDELLQKLEPYEDLNTILSSREYVADARFTACVWAQEGAPYSLEVLRKALRTPALTPYLGRKCCVAAPFGPEIIGAEDVLAAFAQYAYEPELPLPAVKSGTLAVFSDEGGVSDDGSLGELEQVLSVRDKLLAPETRRFGMRKEFVYHVNPQGEV